MPFDIGFIELCILLIVGLTVLGPDKLPVAARQLSKWFGAVRRSVNSFTSEMGRELEMDELRRQVKAQHEKLDATVDLVSNKDDAGHSPSTTIRPAKTDGQSKSIQMKRPV